MSDGYPQLDLTKAEVDEIEDALYTLGLKYGVKAVGTVWWTIRQLVKDTKDER